MMPSRVGPDAGQIREMFRSIAGDYDRANNILSVGVHHLWRRKLVRWSEARTGDAVLDCATGTGDLAIAFREVVGAQGRVVGTDFCEAMLERAPEKAARFTEGLRFAVADVTALPYPTAEFDVSSISFGIRNVQDPLKGLSELARVVKPGGRVMVLEFGQPRWTPLRQLYDLYAAHVLPALGGLITGQKKAYEYLEKSSHKFPCGKDFVSLMRDTQSFTSVEFRSLSGGIAYLYKGVRK